MLEQFVKRIVLPTFTHRLEIRSDGNDDYTFVLPEFFRTDTINYGQLIKIRESGRVVDKVRRVVYGNPKRNDIETTDVENFNGILREHLGRLVRRTKCYAKSGIRFMHELHENLTPAKMEDITHKTWTWGNLLHYRIKLT
ncbi:IS1 family transposase [archaeon]|nr:IS1 family transposase [archaeon]